MRKRKVLLVLCALIILLATFTIGCESNSGSVEVEKKDLSIGTSTTGGNYYLVGSGWANLITNESEYNVSSEVTGGSTANMTMVQNGEIDFGITMGSIIMEGLVGEADWTQGKTTDKIRTLFPLYPSHLTVYSLKSKGINSIHDLNNMRVGTGNLGAGVDSIAKRIFELLEVVPKNYHNDSHGNTVTAVGDDVIDVGVSFQNPPYPALMDLETGKDVSFVALTQDEIDKILQDMPYLYQGKIPAGSYKGNDVDIDTVTDWNWIVCNEDLDEDLVYEIVKSTFENKEKLLSIHRALENVDVENYQYSTTKLHSGVIKYLEENNIEVPNELK